MLLVHKLNLARSFQQRRSDTLVNVLFEDLIHRYRLPFTVALVAVLIMPAAIQRGSIAAILGVSLALSVPAVMILHRIGVSRRESP